MNPRPGFTLLELMVALVIGSVVALLAYGTARAGLDASARLQEQRATVEAQAIMRAFLLDALRHPAEGGGAAMNDTLFVLHNATGADGLPADAVQFFSRGVIAPLGTSGTWLVSVMPTTAGVRLLARPVGMEQAPIDALLPSARGLNVRVLDRTADSAWTEHWSVAGRLPAAVVVEFFSARGALLGPALIAHGALEEVR